jgi:O-antigen/teichoic acid export membrane protein
MVEQAHRPGFWRNVAASGRTPVLRIAYHLFVTTGLNAALGVVYWITAARLYPVDVVGAGAGAISAVLLLSSAGFIGLQFVLMRYVPSAGSHATALVASIYAIACVIAMAGAGVFVAGFAGLAGLGFVTAHLIGGLAFVGGVGLWTVFSLQDAVLISVRQSRWVPAENAGYALLKLVLVVVLATAASPWALLGTWVAATLPFVLAINAALWARRSAVRRRPVFALPPARRLVRLGLGQHAVGLFAALPDFLVPLLVLGLLSSEATAYYYAAWNVSLSLRSLAVNMASALTVEGAHAEEALWRLVRLTGRLATALLVPLILVLLIAAGPIMGTFGAGYGTQSAGPLRIFAVGLIPYTVIVLSVAVERVRERTGTALFVTALTAAVTIALELILIPRMGVDGACVAWLIAQLVGAMTALATLVARPILSRPGRTIP